MHDSARQERRAMSNELCGKKDMEPWRFNIKIVQHHLLKNHPLWWFYGHFWHHSSLLGIWLTLTHSLGAVSQPSSSQVINQAIFPFIFYLFPMMSHCVVFYYSFCSDSDSRWLMFWLIHVSLLYIKRLSLEVVAVGHCCTYNGNILSLAAIIFILDLLSFCLLP